MRLIFLYILAQEIEPGLAQSTPVSPFLNSGHHIPERIKTSLDLPWIIRDHLRVPGNIFVLLDLPLVSLPLWFGLSSVKPVSSRRSSTSATIR
jgi:hypothetical protein